MKRLVGTPFFWPYTQQLTGHNAIQNNLVGLFIAGLAYLSYKGWIDVKWVVMDNPTRSMLTNVVGQAVRALNNTASQFAVHSTTLQTSGLPVAAAFGFMLGLIFGLKRG